MTLFPVKGTSPNSANGLGLKHYLVDLRAHRDHAATFRVGVGEGLKENENFFWGGGRGRMLLDFQFSRLSCNLKGFVQHWMFAFAIFVQLTKRF